MKIMYMEEKVERLQGLIDIALPILNEAVEAHFKKLQEGEVANPPRYAFVISLENKSFQAICESLYEKDKHLYVRIGAAEHFPKKGSYDSLKKELLFAFGKYAAAVSSTILQVPTSEDWTPVTSSMISAVRWSANVLYVKFANMSVYAYHNVSEETFNNMMAVDSVGKAFNSLVKNFTDTYLLREVHSIEESDPAQYSGIWEPVVIF